MNLIVCKHPNDNGKYLFQVPPGETIDAGTLVAVNTVRGGDQPAICVTSSFNADFSVVGPLWGATPKNLQRVTKILREFVLKWPQEQETQKDED